MNESDIAELHRQAVLKRLQRLEEQVLALQRMVRELLEHVSRIAGKQMRDE